MRLAKPVKCPVCQTIRATHRGKITKHIHEHMARTKKWITQCPGSAMVVNDKIVRVRLS